MATDAEHSIVTHVSCSRKEQRALELNRIFGYIDFPGGWFSRWGLGSWKGPGRGPGGSCWLLGPLGRSWGGIGRNPAGFLTRRWAERHSEFFIQWWLCWVVRWLKLGCNIRDKPRYGSQD